MAKKTSLKVVGKGYGYFNVTENGLARRPHMSIAVVKDLVEEARKNYPNAVFAIIEFDVVEDFQIVWHQGRGRAGNSFPSKERVLRWVPRYDRIVEG